jgi:hypothetical protein
MISMTASPAPAGREDSAICSSGEASTFRPLWNNTPLPQEFSRDLQPLEVLFIEIGQSVSTPERLGTQAQ